jgi:hypothetical protein
MIKTLPIQLLSFCLLSYSFAQGDETVRPGDGSIVEAARTAKSFPLVQDGKAAEIVFDAAEAPVIKIAAEALGKDIALVTGVSPGIRRSGETLPRLAIIIGTVEKSQYIKAMLKEKKLPAERLEGKWETFAIAVVDQPLDGVDRAVVIAGSDPRGAAFGVFELSKQIGVSPWWWWADVQPEKRKELFIRAGTIVEGPPSVKYRGIFINDEDWGMKPWAAAGLDSDVNDIGPKTYAKVFELLLRLKANFIWPAMHDCTKAFYYHKENPKVADQYSIVVGSSHCEPMLRNNVDEWTNNFKSEYGKAPGPWRYDTNKEEIHRYWEDRAKESANYESVYTMGMRGIHDSDMPGPKTAAEKIALLDKVIADQRQILAENLKKPIDQIPQIFCPYKEVLSLYQKGLALPDDVTIVWADDNHGYIRQLSTPEEQRRSGQSGVYYHLSYWGRPADYLWLCSTSPVLVSYEMTKAYEYGARRLWVFNVGDIKPAEAELQFALDLAWNVNAWPPEKARLYMKQWAAETFGPEFAQQIADIKRDEYQLGQTGKPEHLDKITFTRAEAQRRLEACERIIDEVQTLGEKIPERLKDAYFQLVLYPAVCACRMNEKFLYARMSYDPPPGETNSPAEYAQKAKFAFSEIQRLTWVYNQEIAGGKWNKMMDYKPRKQPVFNMPPVAEGSDGKKVFDEKTPLLVIDAAKFAESHDGTVGKLHVIEDLGVSGSSITMLPITAASISDENAAQAPFAQYEAKLPAGQRTVEVICVPTHRIHAGRGLRYAISLGNEPPTIVSVNAAAETPQWDKNVLRGYSVGSSSHKLDGDETVKIRIAPLDPGLVISQIRIY